MVVLFAPDIHQLLFSDLEYQQIEEAMDVGWQEKLDSLVSIEADVDITVTQEGDDTVYSLRLTHIERTKGDIQSGPYKAIILALRQPEPTKE